MQALDEDGEIVKIEFTDVDGRFTIPLEPGVTVDLLAAPPPEDAEFYEFTKADFDRSTKLESVAARGLRRRPRPPSREGVVRLTSASPSDHSPGHLEAAFFSGSRSNLSIR